MREYLELLLKIRYYQNEEDIVMASPNPEDDFDDPNVDDNGWT